MKALVPCLIGLVALGFAREARADEADPWWGRDKALHFGLSAGLAAGGYGAASLFLDERWHRAAVGAGFALSLGAGKELYDASSGGDASAKDLTWDVAGTAVGIGLALLVDYLATGSGGANGRAGAAWVF